MGKNKDRKKKGAVVQKTATKAKKKTEKELKKQIEQLGEVRNSLIEFLILYFFCLNSGKYRTINYETYWKGFKNRCCNH
jgi:hypothetical protein